MNLTLGNILPRLCGVRRAGSGYVACCPNHDDREPSLSIREGKGGRILLRCFAGCSYQALLHALKPGPQRSGPTIPLPSRVFARPTIAPASSAPAGSGARRGRCPARPPRPISKGGESGCRPGRRRCVFTRPARIRPARACPPWLPPSATLAKGNSSFTACIASTLHPTAARPPSSRARPRSEP